MRALNFEILKSDYAPVAKSFKSIKNLEKKIFENIYENKKTNLIYFSSPLYLEKFYLKNLKDIKTKPPITPKQYKEGDYSTRQFLESGNLNRMLSNIAYNDQ